MSGHARSPPAGRKGSGLQASRWDRRSLPEIEDRQRSSCQRRIWDECLGAIKGYRGFYSHGKYVVYQRRGRSRGIKVSDTDDRLSLHTTTLPERIRQHPPEGNKERCYPLLQAREFPDRRFADLP